LNKTDLGPNGNGKNRPEKIEAGEDRHDLQLSIANLMTIIRLEDVAF